MKNKNDIDKDTFADTELSKSDLLHYLFIVAKYKLFIFFVTFSIGITTAIVSLLLPEWWASKAAIIVPDSSINPIGSLLGNLPFDIGNSETGNERILAILDSRQIKENIIEKFDLQNVYNIPIMSKTISELESNYSFYVDDDKNIIEISMSYKSDTLKCVEILNYIIEELDRINKNLSAENARSFRIYIEKEYLKNLNVLKAYEDSLNRFQKKYGVFEIKSQAEETFKTLGNIYGQLIIAESEYNILCKSMSDKHPMAVNAKIKLDELRNVAYQLETGSKIEKVIIPLKQMPDLSLEYLRLFREIQIQTELQKFLLPQYEKAKADEAKDTPTIQILDKPSIPDQRIKPKRTRMVLISVFIGFMLSTIFTIFFEKYKKLDKENPSKLQEIRLIIGEFYRFKSK